MSTTTSSELETTRADATVTNHLNNKRQRMRKIVPQGWIKSEGLKSWESHAQMPTSAQQQRFSDNRDYTYPAICPTMAAFLWPFWTVTSC